MATTNRTSFAAAAFLSLSALAFLAGCESESAGDNAGKYWNTEKTKSAQASSSSASSSSSSFSNSSATTTEDGLAADEIPFGSLHWSFGGVNGHGAVKTTASIGHLHTDSKSMTYRWTGPTLKSWGLSDGNAGALACFFVQRADGKWVGGKFDWISTSRTSRGFENIRSHYNGWSLSGVPNPCPCAFVIISSNCKKRTNVIAGTWRR